MTLADVIERVELHKPNQFPIEAKIMWISLLDRIVWTEVIKTHALPSGIDEDDTFDGYGIDDQDTDALIAEPYASDCYYYWIAAQMDLANGETLRYNQDITMFQSAYSQYTGWYNRTYMPTCTARRFVF